MSQVIKKFIGDDQVGAAKIRLENNSNLTARNAADNGDVNILKVNASDAIEVLGAAQVNGNITPDGNNTREVGSASANYQRVNASEILGAAGVNLFADTGSTQIASGDETIDLISWNGSVAPSLRLFNAATSQSAAIKVPNALAGSYTLTLPVDDGTSGQVLQTDGAGVLSWVTPTGGATPATETFVLAGGDITNQYVTLANTPIAGSVHFMVKGAGVLLEGASYDYSISGAQVNFLNDIATGGPAALIAGDVVQVKYMY